MRIIADNLPERSRVELGADLADVARLGIARGIVLPDVGVQVVALECGELPEGMPRHGVPTPTADTPVVFADRCEWEARRQSFQIVDNGDTVWVIGGGVSGALYGFGELLSCRSGVIWSGPLDPDVLLGPIRELPDGVQCPAIPFRDADMPCFDLTPLQRARYMGRNRMNVCRYTGAWYGLSADERAGVVEALRSRCIYLRVGEHAMDLYMPEEEFSRHPEWFGLRDGTRVVRGRITMPECPNLEPEIAIQPCYSNPAALAFIAERMAEYIRQCPEIDILSVWPHDGINNWCQCADCLEKTPAEHMFRLAEILAPLLPDKVVMEMIAYSNLLKTPTRPLPRSERTFSMICPYLRRFWYRVFEQGGPSEPVTGCLYPEPDRINPLDEREYGTLFDRWLPVWAQCGSVPAVFEYSGVFFDETRQYDHRYFYQPSADIRRDEIAWYAERGVKVFYLCLGGNMWPDAFHQHAICRHLWDPEISVEATEREYYVALAGDDGMRLRKAVKDVAIRLRRGNDVPEDRLKVLAVVLDALPAAPFVERYRIWVHYVRRGRRSRQHELAGEYAEGVACEQAIQSFIAENAAVVDGYVGANALTKYSQLTEQRLRERMTGDKAGEYTM